MPAAVLPDSYRFGPYLLDIRERRLTRGLRVVPLRGKLFDTLAILVENAGRLITKDELLDAIWPETAVGEGNLNHNVSLLRKSLGEKATGQKYIETVPRVGYRFVASVEGASGTIGPVFPHPNQTRAARARQEIGCCLTRDGIRLAYATSGDGPPLVRTAHALSHIDLEWDNPVWRHWWTALSAHHRLVRYDDRGSGLSQRDVPDVTFEKWVQDLETVVDAVSLDRFALLGFSRGGPVALAYTVKHPERVTRLVLSGAPAAGANHLATAEEAEARRAMTSLTRLGWCLKYADFRNLVTRRLVSDAAPEHARGCGELLRACTSPELAARLMEQEDEIDIRPLLPQVRVPTLIMHGDRDEAVPAEQGRTLAAGIAGARYVSLPTANHFIVEDDRAWPLLLEELGRFLNWRGKAVSYQPTERLITDD